MHICKWMLTIILEIIMLKEIKIKIYSMELLQKISTIQNLIELHMLLPIILIIWDQMLIILVKIILIIMKLIEIVDMVILIILTKIIIFLIMKIILITIMNLIMIIIKK